MIKITCPSCGEQIELGKDQYNSLLNDIEKNEIDKRVKERLTDAQKAIEAQYKIEQQKEQMSHQIALMQLKKEKELLSEKLENASKDKELAISKALETTKQENSDKNELIAKLKGEIDTLKKDKELSLKQIEEQYKFNIQVKNEEIEKWKNFRIGGSTKALGESLEQYCKDAFDEIRMSAYPNAYFEKDNDVDDSGKGDFIFRDYIDGIETISIMFEMKNQNDATKTKHKNEHFFEKLDKNRTSKKCEYAVLVSTLEEDSELYNKGIVDVSYRYPKMYVVRPQQFLTIIALLRNMSTNTFNYKKQLVEYRQENIDITNFEDSVKAIMKKVADDYEHASVVYGNVEAMCDALISKISDFKEKFRIATGWIDKAKTQVGNLEIKKLTRNNKTMKERFEELEHKKGE